MDSGPLSVGVFPHDLFLSSHFNQLRSVPVFTTACVACDDDVAIGENLATAGVLQPVSGKVVVGECPGDLAVGVEVDDSVSVSTADERVTISVLDGGEGPGVNLVFGVARSSCVQLAQDFAVAGIVEYRKVQQMWCKEGSVGELASHPGLHVMVLLLTSQGELQYHVASGTDFEQSGIVARLSDDKRVIRGWLRAVDLALSAFPDQCFLAFGSDGDDSSAAVAFRFAQRQNDRAVVQYVAVASGGRIRPARFSIGFHDVGLLATREKAVRDLLSTRAVAKDAE